MENVLIFFVISLFVALLFVNLYFRAKVLKSYRRLVRNRVQFDAKDIMNRQRVIDDIVPLYPEHEEDIMSFVDHIRFSVRIAMILIVLITIFGAILMYFR